MSLPWRIVLFVSLALNLLVLGGVVGAYAAGARLERVSEPPAGAMQTGAPRTFMALLPADVRRQVRAELVRTWAQSGDIRAEAMAARREALAALAAEPYDPARLRAAFAQMRAADLRVAETFHEAVARTVGELTPAQRAAAAGALSAPRETLRERRRAWRQGREDARERLRERRQERLAGERP